MYHKKNTYSSPRLERAHKAIAKADFYDKYLEGKKKREKKRVQYYDDLDTAEYGPQDQIYAASKYVRVKREGNRKPQIEVESEVEEYPGEQITSKEILSFAKEWPEAYVIVYAHWCGHCHHLLHALGGPEADSAYQGKKVLNVDTHNNFIFIEADDLSKEATKKFKITGFPTILKFEHGRQVSEKLINRDDVINYFHEHGYKLGKLIDKNSSISTRGAHEPEDGYRDLGGPCRCYKQYRDPNGARDLGVPCRC